MYNKLSVNCNKRRVYDYEGEPPEKKLVSDGDIYIKELAKKQRCTKVDLEELSTSGRFYKSTEEISVTNYTSGANSLDDFNSVVKHSGDVEKLKSHGLTEGEIELLFDYQKGYIKDKYKHVNGDVLQDRLGKILAKVEKPEVAFEEVTCDGRLNRELLLSTKPQSTETKLLKFALENQRQNKKLPGPMDYIKGIEHQLMQSLSPIDIKKIRRKARSLKKQIDSIETTVVLEPQMKGRNSDINRLTENSKWDLKEPPANKAPDNKVFTCKPQNYYTIRDGQIVRITPPPAEKVPPKKLSLDEIMKIPKFQNYEKGIPTKVLYLKNLGNGVVEDNLRQMFDNFARDVVSVSVMKGRMQGQAFVEFTDEKIAEKALDQCNGVILKTKPIIIQFGREKTALKVTNSLLQK